MRILKFGGSSLASPRRIANVAAIVRQATDTDRVAVVVSAMGGTTDALLGAARAASHGDPSFEDTCKHLAGRHLEALEELAPPAQQPTLRDAVHERIGDLGDLLRGACLVREASLRTVDSVLSFGERLSSIIVASALRAAGVDAEPCDARTMIVTDATFGRARVDVETTYRRIREHVGSAGALQVITGFIGATPDGETTTLGRGGSDYTASLVGAAIGAETVELWTDVDGVMSADPRVVSSASTVPELSYEELMELSHFGAKVVYPPSVHPVRSAGVPLVIRNSLRPEAAGTRIAPERSADPEQRTICGISSIRDVSLLRLEGDGMVGVPGIAERLFRALAARGISVILITQASSEHSICFAVTPGAVAGAERCVEAEFTLERRAGLVDELVVENGLSVIAVVGAGMRERPGIAGRLFGVLGDYGINVRAIAQGSSELNISFVVRGDDEPRALRVIHEVFYTPHRRSVDLAVAGVGRVGKVLLAQIHDHRATLERQYGLRLRVIGLAASRGGWLDAEGIDGPEAVERVLASAPVGLDELLAAFGEERWPKKVFVDCTASTDVAERYDRLLRAGVSVVTANKLRLAGPLADYHELMGAGPGRLFYETTVGAGLPVIRTLQDLCTTGDTVLRIDGLLSGTLAYITDELAGGHAFSDIVRRAYDLGYTEPDPREDLFGSDVGRKLIILGRLAGLPLEPEDVSIESLLPSEDWRRMDLDEFWKRLPSMDDTFATRQREAANAGRRMCYLGTIGDGTASVKLDAVPPEHPCGTARGTDNLIAFTTDRYRDNPLVVRGPGAGPEVTAAGVLADVLRAVVEDR